MLISGSVSLMPIICAMGTPRAAANVSAWDVLCETLLDLVEVTTSACNLPLSRLIRLSCR